MSDGYTPVFASVFTGTLHGRWPDTGLWLCLLAMANKHGEVDCTPQYIASATGLEVTEVTACIERFMQPDPYSRTQGEEGRRLVLLDASRPWGWQIVNHALYRERARLMSKSAREVASGANKQRMKSGPPETAGDRRSPPETTADPLSDSNANTDLNKNPQEKTPVGKNARKRATSASTEFPLDFALDDALRAQALSRTPDCDVEAAFEQFRAHHQASGSRMKSWPAAWRTWIGNFERFGYPKRRNGALSLEERVRENSGWR